MVSKVNNIFYSPGQGSGSPLAAHALPGAIRTSPSSQSSPRSSLGASPNAGSTHSITARRVLFADSQRGDASSVSQMERAFSSLQFRPNLLSGSDASNHLAETESSMGVESSPTSLARQQYRTRRFSPERAAAAAQSVEENIPEVTTVRADALFRRMHTHFRTACAWIDKKTSEGASDGPLGKLLAHPFVDPARANTRVYPLGSEAHNEHARRMADIQQFEQTTVADVSELSGVFELAAQHHKSGRRPATRARAKMQAEAAKRELLAQAVLAGQVHYLGWAEGSPRSRVVTTEQAGLSPRRSPQSPLRRSPRRPAQLSSSPNSVRTVRQLRGSPKTTP